MCTDDALTHKDGSCDGWGLRVSARRGMRRGRGHQAGWHAWPAAACALLLACARAHALEHLAPGGLSCDGWGLRVSARRGMRRGRGHQAGWHAWPAAACALLLACARAHALEHLAPGGFPVAEVTARLIMAAGRKAHKGGWCPPALRMLSKTSAAVNPARLAARHSPFARSGGAAATATVVRPRLGGAPRYLANTAEIHSTV
ncbi:hypothetical protein RR46_12013 [Papilio xuthus]|uniref:Uncharacterized protein n=1 Tax=Papilio xuthus TaxID=66420 RepID=A0A194PQJ4_PAPXU|nr:hypothetical protein RR46_12013 [Papilio xuthus]